MRHDLDRQTSFEEDLLLEITDGRRFRRDERSIERVVLALRHRTIQIVALPIVDAARGPNGCAIDGRLRLAAWYRRGRRLRACATIPSRGAKHLRHVDRLGQHDRTD